MLSASGIFSLRGIMVLLIGLLISFRGLVPAGYMLEANPDDGSVIIRMCGGLEEHYVRFNPETGEMRSADGPADQEAPGDPQEDAPGAACPYALSAVVALPEPLPGEVLIGLYGPPLLSDRPVLVPVYSYKPVPVLPRGPPLFV